MTLLLNLYLVVIPSKAFPLLEEEENRIIILRNAIREGIESGRAVDFDPKKHLETLKSRKK